MTLLNVGGALAPGAKSLGKQLSVMSGLQALYLFSSNYISGTVLQNLAPGGGAGNAAIVGAPTISGGIFTVNTAGTDYIQLPFGDSGGDLTFYWVFKNLDTLASGTTTPVIIGNTGNEAAHGNVPSGTKGTNVAISAANTITLHDYEILGTYQNEHVNQTVPVMTAPSRWMSGAATSAYNSGTTTATLGIYDNTAADNVGAVITPFTGCTGRAFNLANSWRVCSNVNGNYGLMALAAIGIYETASGAGGAHNANQVAAVGADLRGIVSALGITV